MKTRRRRAKWQKDLSADDWIHLQTSVEPGQKLTLRAIRANGSAGFCSQCERIAGSLGLLEKEKEVTKEN